ncbi:MAG: hypothetical protein JW942_08145 [Opitutales bacterium]|nr:hypothetical protein [Opitutales bacterium]
MRISDVTSTYTISSRLMNIKSEEAQITEELLTGRKINSLQDDAAVGNSLLLSQAERERLVQYNSNSTLSNSIAQSGIDALKHIGEVNELALSIAESSTEDDSTTAVKNLDSLIEDVLATANTKFGDEYIFAGTASASDTAPFTLDATGQYIYNGTAEGRSIEVSDGISVSPFTGSEGTQAILDTLNSLVLLRDAVAANDKDEIATQSAALESADDAVLEASSDLGMVQYRLEIMDTRNAAKYSAYDKAESNATAADENESTVNLLATQNAYSAALQTAAKILDMSLLDYI